MIKSFLNFFNSGIFINNVFVVISIRIVCLLLLIKAINICVNFFLHKMVNNIDNVEQQKQAKTIFITIKSTVLVVISILFIIEILPKLGIDIRPILTAAGVLGIAAGFGAKRLVEDILSGASLILEGEVRVGDIIETNGKLGTVEKLNLKKVTLRDFDGKVHYIRNGMIDIVTNYTRDYAYAMIDIGVAYKENIDNVIQTVIDIANNDLKNGICKDYIIGDLEVWGINNFSDSSVDLKFRIKTIPVYQWAVKREFYRLIKIKFDELNIEIPFPQRVVHIEKE